MKNQNRRNPSNTTSTNRMVGHPQGASVSVLEHHFETLTTQEPLVEHATIPAFLKRIEHRWDLNDIRRFGDQVAKTAEALQLAYLTRNDGSLGILRAFPVPMLERVYTIQRLQFGWPELHPDSALDEVQKNRQLIRSMERTINQLREEIKGTEDVEVVTAMTRTADAMDKKLESLRALANTPVLPARN